MSVYKRGKGTHWHYYFRVRGVRYRGSIPEATTKQKAEQAESKIKQEIFEGKFGKVEAGTMKLTDFIDDIYMLWAKSNKRSWRNDHYNSVILKEFLENKELRAIQPLRLRDSRPSDWRPKRSMTRSAHQHRLIASSSFCRVSSL